MVLSARPVTKQRMSSKYASAMMSLSNKGLASNKRAKGRSVINEFEIKTNKDFTRRVMQEALSGDFKNDPLMLEAIIAQELARDLERAMPDFLVGRFNDRPFHRAADDIAMRMLDRGVIQHGVHERGIRMHPQTLPLHRLRMSRHAATLRPPRSTRPCVNPCVTTSPMVTSGGLRRVTTSPKSPLSERLSAA